jgi:hypothetical protein
MIIPVEVWGPRYWYVFHTACYAYPKRPNRVAKKKMYDFVQNIPFLLPDIPISNLFAKLLDKYPVSSYLDDRDSLMRWFHFIHNQINLAIGKPEIPFEESIRQYHEFTTKHTIQSKDQKHLYIRNVIHQYQTPIVFASVICLGILIYFLYK